MFILLMLLLFITRAAGVRSRRMVILMVRIIILFFLAASLKLRRRVMALFITPMVLNGLRMKRLLELRGRRVLKRLTVVKVRSRTLTESPPCRAPRSWKSFVALLLRSVTTSKVLFMRALLMCLMSKLRPTRIKRPKSPAPLWNFVSW